MDLEKALADARASGDADQLAELLVRRATELVDTGELDPARRLLDEAAGIHGDRGRAVDEARCLTFAATLCRATGRLDQAESRAGRAERRAPAGSAPSVSAPTELGEIASMRRDFAAAAAAYNRAVDAGDAAGLVDTARAALLRKRAQARVLAGDVDAAIGDLGTAETLYRGAGDDGEARKTAVELATALEALERADDLTALLDRLRPEADAAGDRWVLADLDLLRASQLIVESAIDDALAASRAARDHALASTHPIAYVAAALAIAELEESRGDRVAAYEALAVGWATLGDLLGEDVGKSTFAPKLEEQRQRWGDDGFVAARDAYYARREALKD